MDPDITPDARAHRLRRLRNLANLKRHDVCSDPEIPINLNTYKGWEIGRYGGLTRRGAEKVLQRFAKEGVICTLDWLYYGIGAGPQIRLDPTADSPRDFSAWREDPLALWSSEIRSPGVASNAKKRDETRIAEQQIVKELVVFRHQSHHSVDLIVEDDGMLPHYQIGDYVAGIRRFGDAIADLIGLDCIVQTAEGITLFRKLRLDTQAGLYTLLCTNTHTTVRMPALYHVAVVSAAPVIWHRKQEPHSGIGETK